MAAKLLVLFVLSFSAGIAAQQEECYSTDWFIDFGSCFLQKWIDLLSGIAPEQAEYRHDTRRSLQSMSLLAPEVHVVGNKVGVASTLERLTTKAKNMQDEYLSEDIMNTVIQQMRNLADPSSGFHTRKMNSEQKERMKILEKVGKVDTTKVINKVAEEALSIAQQVQYTLLEMMPPPDQLKEFIEQASLKTNQTFSFQSANFNAEITDVFAQLAELLPLMPLGCALCPGSNCFVPFDEILCTPGGLELLGELSDVVRCMNDNNFTETDFEDGIEWMKCVYRCEDVAPIGECVQAVSSTCENAGVGDFFLEIVAEYIFKLGECRLEVPTTSFNLEEGDDTKFFEVKSYMPHTLYCLDFSVVNTPIGMVGLLVDWISGGFGECPVEIQVSTHNYLYNVLSMDIGLEILGGRTINITSGWPRCMSGPLVNQALIGRHEYDGDCACSVELNQNSWNETHVFPLAAAIDNKVDGDVVSQLTVKLRVKGFTVQSQKITMNIIDRDLPNPVCASLGDPHITTYDGYYFDNSEDGYFTMYKHLTLPYEIQVRRQICSASTVLSCTCAVAILSGDDVFVLDRCLEDGAAEVPPTRTVMYLNGDLNPGTRVFVQDDGMKYQVVLPMGTIITMMTGVENSVSVWIQASANDRKESGWRGSNKVLGLCGTYDGDADASNEQTQPDGTETSNTDDFINSWRVADADSLFEGAVQNDNLTTVPEMCRCSYMIMFGVQCRCGHDQYVDLCDFNKDGEITDTIQMIGVQSEKQRAMEGKRPNWHHRTFSAKAQSIRKKPFTSWNETTAESECREAILGDPMVSLCITDLTGFSDAEVQNEIVGCKADIMATQNTTFVGAAVESAKQRCKVVMSQAAGMRNSLLFRNMTRLDCPYSCSGNGFCNNSICECDAGFTGADCSRQSDAAVTISQAAISSCDSRGADCQFAAILGSQFNTDDYNLTYYVRQNELTSSGSIQPHDETRQAAEAVVISQSQMAATLPDGCLLDQELCQGSQAFGGLYELELEGVDFKPQILVYDSACYDCSVTDTSASCKLKTSMDYCVISSGCYSPTDNRDGDECAVCDPNQSTSDWSVNVSSQACVDAYNERIESQEAEDQEDLIRIIVACALSGTVILVAIILFCTVGRKAKKYSTNRNSKKDGGANGTVVTSEEQYDDVTIDKTQGFITDNGVTLVKPNPNGEVNTGFDYVYETEQGDLYEKM